MDYSKNGFKVNYLGLMTKVLELKSLIAQQEETLYKTPIGRVPADHMYITELFSELRYHVDHMTYLLAEDFRRKERMRPEIQQIQRYPVLGNTSAVFTWGDKAKNGDKDKK